ncbi:MAG: prepilin-type N-terminal cleavage/methylation domain-containing protein, partial [Gemmataceae bacterium]|nr:prepilin-type N-terminal cleavage/methylation domain-containing protein [Gemmataceae bacterium]
MTRRSGLTLVEVLVAMFIMSIGMIALLTLFPIGVLRMAQSIRDARCEQMGRNAYATAVMENVGADVVTGALDNTGLAVIPDNFVNPSPKTITGAPNLPDADPYAESYPILVDPVAYVQGGSDWVGNVPDVLRRRPVEFIRRPALTGAAVTLNALRSFSLWDELRFNSSLTAAVPPGTPQKVGAAVLRDPRFTSAYVLRRPQTGDKSLVDCTVIVYENRSVAAL